MFDINSGDTLLLLADKDKGIAIQKYEVFSKIADAILDSKAKEIYPENKEDDSITFASAIKAVREE